ncbi:MAG TPA: hypothetical protein VIU11_13035, partial [Nakamurella sp.]
MIIPNPARLVIVSREFDPMTELVDETVLDPMYVRDVADVGNGVVRWSNRTTQLYGLVDHGDKVVGVNQPVNADPAVEDVVPPWTYTFHQVTPYDAVTLAPTAGVPQPLLVVRAEIQEGSMLAQQLDAVVAPDNTVVTLMLETGLGVYLRYGGDWRALENDSATLEDLGIVQVGSGALNTYDAAESAGVTLSVFELPTVTQDADAEIVDPDELPSLAERQAVTASIPVVASAADLGMAIRFAQMHPAARWYVTKRAHALLAADEIPAEWAGEQVQAVTAGGLRLDSQAAVLTAAGLYRGLTDSADPDDDFYRSVLAAARRHDLLRAPDVVMAIRAHGRRRHLVLAAGGEPANPSRGLTASRQALRARVHDGIISTAGPRPLVAGPLSGVRNAFQEWQHPRGSDGKFVNKGGSVNITPAGGGAPKRGKITRLTEAGPTVRYADGSIEVVPLADVGTRVSKAPRQRARLDAPEATPPGGEDEAAIMERMRRIMQGGDAVPPPGSPTGAPPEEPNAPDDPPEVPPPPSEPAEDLSGLSDKAKDRVENLKVREIPKGFKLYYDEATDSVLAKDRLGTVWVVDDLGYYGTPLDPRHRREIDEQTMVDVTEHVKPLGNQVVNPEEGGSIYDTPSGKPDTAAANGPDVDPDVTDLLEEQGIEEVTLAPNKPATPDQVDPDAAPEEPAIKDEELAGALEEGVVDPHLNEMKAEGNVSPTPARKVKASELVANGVVVSQANQDKIDKMPELDEGDRVVVNPVNDDLYVQDKDGNLRVVDDDGQLSEPFAPPPLPQGEQDRQEAERQAQPPEAPEGNAPPEGAPEGE